MKLRRILTVLLLVTLIPASFEMLLRFTMPRTPWLTLMRQEEGSVFTAMQSVPIRDDGSAADYASTFVNVVKGERFTVGQPDHFSHEVYMFGSSTLFGYANTDSGTLPSQLQRLLPQWRVHNMGVIGDSVILMTSRLLHTKLHPGDVVIFYDGYIDMAQIAHGLDDKQFDLCRYLLQNANDVLTVHLLCDNAVHPSTLDKTALEDGLKRYQPYVNAARAYTLAAGARFYNILEPVKGTLPLSNQERLMDSYEPVTATLNAIYPQIYAAFETAGAIDLSHTLDAQRQAGIEVYVDNYHVTDSANAVMAKALYSATQ